MGLYASFSPEDLGYQLFISAEDVEVEVDYSSALEEAVATFISVATDLVPVRTGYLRSTINADTDGYEFAEFYADAEYAQYVEYGTWCCPEQPYFRPALGMALEAFLVLAQEAYEEAQEELQDILTEMMETSMEMSSMGMPMGMPMGSAGGGFFGGLAMFAISFIILFPILVNLYTIMDTIFGSGSSRGSISTAFGSGSSRGYISIDDLIEII